MHVAPIDLRAIRQGGIGIRFAMLGAMAYVMAEIPDSGSAGTSLEQPCTQPHWGFVIDGKLTFVTNRRRLAIPAGHAFHVPAGGPEHHFEAAGSVLVAGFQPVESEMDVSDDGLVARGFELVADRTLASIVPAVPLRRVATGQIRAESWPMSAYLMTRIRMGERSGYTAGWCDAPHWGLVIEGRLAIEWEDDVEILAKGDVFHCPPGPPGHRLEAADPATIIDLTPIAALEAAGRLADWRRGTVVVNSAGRTRGIAVAALG
jgi:quercetin dioxygenase-like cupin family protein